MEYLTYERLIAGTYIGTFSGILGTVVGIILYGHPLGRIFSQPQTQSMRLASQTYILILDATIEATELASMNCLPEVVASLASNYPYN